MRHCIKEPVKELFVAYGALRQAVAAHLSGDTLAARDHFAAANCPVVWDWLNTAWTGVAKHVVVRHPTGDTRPIPRPERDPDRAIDRAVRQQVLARDGYRCRYCGLPVVHADIRRIAHHLYPDAVPWDVRDPSKQHAAFQAFWLQFDHVEPHSHGGRSTPENVVIACALCNFAKDRHTLRQLALEDPRTRPPEPSQYDGLEALRSAAIRPVRTGRPSGGQAPEPHHSVAADTPVAYFFAGATIGKGYVNIPPVSGKSRWFRLGPDVAAEYATRAGVTGCVVTCSPHLLERRGLDSRLFTDQP